MKPNLIKTAIKHLKVFGLRGMICAIKAHFTNSQVLFKVRRSDCKNPLFVRIPTTDLGVYKKVFIKKEYLFSTKGNPETIVDAGANIGLAALYFANRYPAARIIAIEPEESNFDLLVENTSLYPNIIPLKAALWHENARISLTDPGMGKWGFRTEAVNIDKSTSLNFRESVTAITVDQLMKDYGLSKIDILKIDIEGAEKEVFSNTSKWITQVNSIIIELHDWMKQGLSLIHI